MCSVGNRLCEVRCIILAIIVCLTCWYNILVTSFLLSTQEFKEGRRGSQTAPQVLFSHAEPPQELQGTDALTGANVGYITFGMLKVLMLN